jgi:hypothetical protein
VLLEGGPHVGDAGFDDGERCRGFGRRPRRLGGGGQCGGEGAEGPTKRKGHFGGKLVDRKVNCVRLGVHLELAVPREGDFNGDDETGTATTRICAEKPARSPFRFAGSLFESPLNFCVIPAMPVERRVPWSPAQSSELSSPREPITVLRDQQRFVSSASLAG